MERKLVAILAADVVGYSRLIGLDETGTVARLRRLRREVIDPLIARYHGRIVKLMGDGALVEFASVVDAVACAVEIQRSVENWARTSPTKRELVSASASIKAPRQRRPRERARSHLKWIATLPCAICLTEGRSQAAHIRILIAVTDILQMVILASGIVAPVLVIDEERLQRNRRRTW